MHADDERIETAGTFVTEEAFHIGRGQRLLQARLHSGEFTDFEGELHFGTLPEGLFHTRQPRRLNRAFQYVGELKVSKRAPAHLALQPNAGLFGLEHGAVGRQRQARCFQLHADQVSLGDGPFAEASLVISHRLTVVLAHLAIELRQAGGGGGVPISGANLRGDLPGGHFALQFRAVLYGAGDVLAAGAFGGGFESLLQVEEMVRVLPVAIGRRLPGAQILTLIDEHRIGARRTLPYLPLR